MQSSFPKSPPQKVKNILTRHTCSKTIRFNSNYQHPEASYLLKYSPKYYKDLTLEITLRKPLLSKVKRIKKVRKFIGLFKDDLPQGLWFNLLKNHRKGIEEMPEIVWTPTKREPSQSLWKRLSLQRMKFFWNVKSLANQGLYSQEPLSFLKSLKPLRNLKNLEISVGEKNYEQIKWILAKLDKMTQFLTRLETFRMRIENANLQEILQNKRVLSYLTSLELNVSFDPMLVEIPQMCKTLTGLSLSFRSVPDNQSQLFEFFTSISHLTRLKSLEFIWPGEAQLFWSQIRPQPSLRCLKLSLSISEDDGKRFQDKDLVAHWEEIEELDMLEICISCEEIEEIVFVRLFITMILGKIRKVLSLKIWVKSPWEWGGCEPFEPFLAEEVPHLYDSLEKFEYKICRDGNYGCAKFDVKMMMPFRKLKVLEVIGGDIDLENIEEIVDLLQENQKEGEYPMLLFKTERMPWSYLFQDTMEKIAQIKRADRNLKIIIDLGFETKDPDDQISLLEELCCVMQSVKTIKGVVVYLSVSQNYYFSEDFGGDEMKKVLERYSDLRNLSIRLSSFGQYVEYIKIDGEKEQFFFDSPFD